MYLKIILNLIHMNYMNKNYIYIYIYIYILLLTKTPQKIYSFIKKRSFRKMNF